MVGVIIVQFNDKSFKKKILLIAPLQSYRPDMKDKFTSLDVSYIYLSRFSLELILLLGHGCYDLSLIFFFSYDVITSNRDMHKQLFQEIDTNSFHYNLIIFLVEGDINFLSLRYNPSVLLLLSSWTMISKLKILAAI